MRPLETLLPLSLLFLFAACGGPDEEELPGPRVLGSATHLLDRPAVEGFPGGATLAAEVTRLVAGDGVWILDEEVPADAWMADGRPSPESSSRRWLARLRYTRERDRCVVPLDRLAIAEERAPAGTGRARAEREGEVVLFREGALSVLRPESAGAPPATRVAYRASTRAVFNDLPAFEPASRILGEESRRVLSAPAPWSRAWELEVPAGARLRFGCGASARRLRAAEGGLVASSGGPAKVTGRVVLQGPDGEELVLRRFEADGGAAEGFRDVLVDLDAHAGQRVRLRIELEDPGAAGELAPLALLAEPVIDAPFAPSEATPPSVLVILIDTLRADRLGCYGWERAHTPTFDSLAAEGVRFTRTTAAAPWTLPSHASLFSSLYVSEHGICNGESLPEEAVTVAELLRDSAYSTAAFTEGAYAGKSYGLTQGFDLFQTGPRDVVRTLERAREWIESVRGPYFAFVQTYQIHAPYDPPDEWREKLVREYHGPLGRVVTDPDHPWGTRGPEVSFSAEDLRYMQDLYDAEIAYTDACAGEFLAALEARGGLANTVVILTADHGEEFGDHGHFGHGWGLYEELLHVPLILRGPGRFGGGRVAEHPVHGVDLAPTIAAIVGADAPPEWSGVALSLEPGLSERAIFTPFFTRKQRDLAAVYRLGMKKLVVFPDGERRFDGNEFPALFDLELDPEERLNLFETGRARPESWIQAVGEAWEEFPSRFQLEEASVDTRVMRELEALGYVGDE